ncbi:MAG: hypothetical protein FJX30_04370, partial [Alphaproteobacteria bacterium]|nr:hypothetical protein [Alphaproteobacteria bacterium]
MINSSAQYSKNSLKFSDLENHENHNPRDNWQVAQVLEYFNMPFNDLIFKASQIHRQFHNPNEVQ